MTNFPQSLQSGLRRGLAGLLVGAAIAPAPASASPCADVVADTVAEMRAGATGWRNDEVESLVRAAAGSACIKALSGRYGVAAMDSEPVATQASQARASDEASKEDSGAAEAAAEDDGSWSVGGLTFRSMSGSPGKKSYERSRSKAED